MPEGREHWHLNQARGLGLNLDTGQSKTRREREPVVSGQAVRQNNHDALTVRLWNAVAINVCTCR